MPSGHKPNRLPGAGQSPDERQQPTARARGSFGGGGGGGGFSEALQEGSRWEPRWHTQGQRWLLCTRPGAGPACPGSPVLMTQPLSGHRFPHVLVRSLKTRGHVRTTRSLGRKPIGAPGGPGPGARTPFSGVLWARGTCVSRSGGNSRSLAAELPFLNPILVLKPSQSPTSSTEIPPTLAE